jgi:putative toxin-antitoxin system antitoxin component (TIGR02293 family)
VSGVAPGWRGTAGHECCVALDGLPYGSYNDAICPTAIAMTSATKSEPADLVEIRSRLRGGPKAQYFYVALLGLRNYEPLKIYDHVRSGLSFASFERFQRNTSLSWTELATLIQLPPRTIARRKAAGRLEPDESDRLLRASRVFGRALELFEGDAEAAREWLLNKQPLLGGRVPLDLATTDVGALEVERLIGRLEHGIPS